MGHAPGGTFDVDAVRAQFPILERTIRLVDGRERPLTYLDHGASTHAPRPVIEAVVRMLSQTYANVHRGNHTLSMESSHAFDAASDTLRSFVRAPPESQ